MNRWCISKRTLGLAALLSTALNCGKGNDDGHHNRDDDNGGQVLSGEVSFDLTQASSLIANKDIIEQVASNRLTVGRNSEDMFTYRVVGDSVGRAENNGAPQGGSNMLAVNAQGITWTAIESEQPIKVMYTVTNPAGTKVYFALDTGWSQGPMAPGGPNFTGFIATNNCALYEVTLADNSHRCAAEGLIVQSMNQDFMKAVSGNQKPIQFDSNGNVYFSASPFARQCDFETHDPETNEKTCGHYRLEFNGSWFGRIYKISAANNAVTALSQDNESISFFLVLPSGEIAYQAFTMNAGHGGGPGAQLYILQGSQKIALTSGNSWADFFTVDTNNAVVFGESNQSGSSGLRIARRASSGVGLEFANLNTSLFGAQQNGQWQNPSPRRIILADDGRVYGIFEGGRAVRNAVTNNYDWTPSLKVYQVLPFDGVPKVELDLPSGGWWHWMQNTPFQIAKGYLYYTETTSVPYVGEVDVIRMVKLQTREKTTLLDPSSNPTGPRYDIQNWRLSGTKLTFSGVDLSTNVVVMGHIDTVKVRDSAPESEYLTVEEAASALGAASEVQDIEVIRPEAPTVDSGVQPTVTKVHRDAENIYSVSVDFSKHMDKASVESKLKLTSANTSLGNSGVIPTMKLWLHTTVHLIPDTGDGLGLPATTPLPFNTAATLTFESGIRDIFSNNLQATSPVTWTSRPAQGWYVGSIDSATATASGNVLKYAVNDDRTMKSFELGNIPDDVRIEFSARNLGWSGIHLMMFDNDTFSTLSSGDVNHRRHVSTFANIRLGGFTNVEYVKSVQSSHGWYNVEKGYVDGETSSKMFNGSWKRYRVDLNSNKIRIYVSDDGTLFHEITTFSKDDFAIRTGSDYRLLLRVSEGMLVDNIVVTELLDTSNTLNSSAEFQFDFNTSGSVPAEFSTDVTSTYSLTNW